MPCTRCGWRGVAGGVGRRHDDQPHGDPGVGRCGCAAGAGGGVAGRVAQGQGCRRDDAGRGPAAVVDGAGADHGRRDRGCSVAGDHPRSGVHVAVGGARAARVVLRVHADQDVDGDCGRDRPASG